jgi:SRSO17 transposase
VSQSRKRSKRRAPRQPPVSGRQPICRLSGRDIVASADELLAFHQRFEHLFARREQRAWSLLYLCGQLSNLERKTIEPMVLALLGPQANAIRTMQHFIGHGEWVGAPFLEQVQSLVADWLGDPDGVVVVDGSGFPKQGGHSAGVAWQYCGHVGKLANCQEGVFVAYASRRGHAFLDACLYVPQDWFTPAYRDRWQACEMPEALTFQTEPGLALEMVTTVVQRARLPFRWVVADARYGEIPAFLDGIAALGKWYLIEVAADTRAWWRTPAVEPPGRSLLGGPPRTRARVKRSAPPPHDMRQLQAQLPQSAWHRRIIKEGSKGPIVAEFAAVRVTPIRDQLPGVRCWAVFRRALGPEPEIKFYLSNAPANCPLHEFVRVSGMRWPIEIAFEEAKGETGMDQYETRTWAGWHHHMTHTILAHLFLVRLCQVSQKKSGAHYRTSPSVDRACDRRRAHRVTRHLSGFAVSPAPEPRGISVTSQANTLATQRQPAPFQAAKTQSFVVRIDLS